MHKFLLLLAFAAGFGETFADPIGEGREPVIMGARVIANVREMREPPPRDFSYLQQQAGRLNGDNREEYLTRWKAFIEESVECDSGAKLGWFMTFAAFTVHTEVKSRNAEVLEQLVLDNPLCALRGIREMLAPHSLLIQSYLLQPSYHKLEELDASLRTAFHEPGFETFTRDYAGQFLLYQERRALKIAYLEAQAAKERRLYWRALQDRKFYTSSEADFWQRWRELVGKVTCDDPETLSYLFEAAAANADIEAVQQESAGLIEPMVLRDPACVLRGMDRISSAKTFIENYLIASSRVEEIHKMIGGVADDAENRSRKTYEQAYAEYRYRIADPVTDSKEFLWSVKTFRSDREGRVFVPSTYIKGDSDFQEKLDALWTNTPEGEVIDYHGDPIKMLPRSALDFMTLGRFGTYYLINITPGGVAIVKARAVAAALSRWGCGDVASLLVLKAETTPIWLLQKGEYPVYSIAIELRDDLPEPQLKRLAWPDDRYFYRGILDWENASRSYEFAYTDAYVGIDFEFTDRTENRRVSLRAFESCH